MTETQKYSALSKVRKETAEQKAQREIEEWSKKDLEKLSK